jgi:hypothetical protein
MDEEALNSMNGGTAALDPPAAVDAILALLPSLSPPDAAVIRARLDEHLARTEAVVVAPSVPVENPPKGSVGTVLVETVVTGMTRAEFEDEAFLRAAKVVARHGLRKGMKMVFEGPALEWWRGVEELTKADEEKERIGLMLQEAAAIGSMRWAQQQQVVSDPSLLPPSPRPQPQPQQGPPDPATNIAIPNLAEPGPDPFRTGGQGKRTAMDFIHRELWRCIDAGDPLAALPNTEAARALSTWWESQRFKFNPPGPYTGPKAIANKIAEMRKVRPGPRPI